MSLQWAPGAVPSRDSAAIWSECTGLSGPTSWRRGALGQSGRPGVSRRVASSAPRGAAPSFPSRAPPRPWSPAWCLLCPGAKRGRGDKVALCHREGDRSGRGPGGLPGGGGLQRTGRLKRLKATLLQKCPPMCAVAPPWPAVQSWPGPCGPPGSVLTLGRPRRCRVPPPWPPGRACAWALRPPLFLSLLHPSPPPGHPSAIWLPWILAATRAGSLNPWTVPEHGGGRALRVTGTDPPGSPALHRPPAPPCLAPAHCATLIRAGLGPVGRAPRPT